MTWGMLIFWLPIFFFAWAMVNPSTALQLLDELQHPEKRWFRQWLAAKENLKNLEAKFKENVAQNGMSSDVADAILAHDTEALVNLLGNTKAKPYLELVKKLEQSSAPKA
ncbi:MAG: hypothetical protein ABI690_29615 [Chloroflexota bacterium]